MLRAVFEIAVWWAAMVVMTVMLISSLAPVELLVAALAAAGAAYAARKLRRAVRLGSLRGRGVFRALAALPWSLVQGTAALARQTLSGGGREAGLRRVDLHPDTGPAWAGYLLAASADTAVIRVGEAGTAADDGGGLETAGSGGPETPDRRGPQVPAAVSVHVHALRPERGAVERALDRDGGER